LERIINGEDFLGVRFFALGQRAGRAIARIDIRTPDGRSGSGTGSLVSSRLLLTNNHVLESADWARGSSAVFDFEDDLENKPRPTVTFQLDPDTFFFTNKTFDFTLVAVKTTALHTGTSLNDYGFNPLNDSQGKVTIGEPINIIQHSSGLLKQVVLQENRLLDLPEDPPGWLHYESDTMPGSSGAPLFNNRWEMVGLHHSGWPKRNEQGQILTVNDQIWTRDMGELAIKWIGNEGARVSQILQIVKAEQAAMDAGRQALVTELLTPPKTGTVVAPPVVEISTPPSERTPVERTTTLGVQSAVMQGCGRKEENKFEPKNGKGAVSRAVMYFLLRYPGFIDDKPAELQAARLQTLLQWHQAEPVSDYERRRNAAIHEKQGNRNPLIDFPDLATRINFGLGLGGA
jgi:endonuclease G